MEQVIDQIASRIHAIGESRKRLAENLDKINSSIRIKKKTEEKVLDHIKICGVDGGFLKKEYHGAGLVLRRAVAVCFEYRSGKLEDTSYLPNPSPVPEAIVTGPELSDIEFNQIANLKRVELEVATGIQAVETFKPNMLVMDGSIFVHPSSVPDKKSAAYPVYLEVCKKYNRLYSVCAQNNTYLVGAVEDSKGRIFCEALSKIIPEASKYGNLEVELRNGLNADSSILAGTTDSLFLFYFLHPGERSRSIDLTGNIRTMYLKAAEYDRPLRLDFIGGSLDDETKIAELIYAISKQNKSYAYPSVLIEADARAKLSEAEIDIFKARLAEKLGINNPSFLDLRRELRPF